MGNKEEPLLSPLAEQSCFRGLSMRPVLQSQWGLKLREVYGTEKPSLKGKPAMAEDTGVLTHMHLSPPPPPPPPPTHTHTFTTSHPKSERWEPAHFPPEGATT